MIALVRFLLLGLVRLLVGAHARWEGCAPTPDARIYIANHTSHLDTLAIMAALPAEIRNLVHPVAALDYWGQTPGKRFVAQSCLGAILVDRTPSGSRDPLRPLADNLEAGHSLILFPEGTRSDGSIAPFKAGLYHLARRFPAVEIVPVYLENLHRVLPKGTMLLVPLICTLRIGGPIKLNQGETKQAFLERSRTELIALGEPAPAGVGRS